LTYVRSHVTILLKGTLFFPFGGFFNEVTRIEEKRSSRKNLALVFSLYLFLFEAATGVAKKEGVAKVQEEGVAKRKRR